ncbi:MAG: 16S rRNA (adenine(1518)-N(6)/adenine(1519)-N(6))-dimethyltransferase RsmA [Promethearchaeota archaeon]
MPFFSRSELLALQHTLGIKLDKSRGQCYLIDKNVIEIIIDFSNLNPLSDSILEIGAGLGILSDYLIQNSSHVFLVENDKKIANFLQEEYSKHYDCKLIDLIKNYDLGEAPIYNNPSKVNIILGDALKIPLPPVTRIVSNIPYQISAPLLFRLMNEWHFDQVNLMVQEEFAKRLVAPPNSSNYSRLAASVGLYFDICLDHLVRPTSFFPPPRINSRLISITRKEKSPDFELKWLYRKDFLEFLRAIFPYKNKSIRNSVRLGFKKYPILLQKLPRLSELIEHPENFPNSQKKTRSFSVEELFQIFIYGIGEKNRNSK